jgi:hypothetical protein
MVTSAANGERRRSIHARWWEPMDGGVDGGAPIVLRLRKRVPRWRTRRWCGCGAWFRQWRVVGARPQAQLTSAMAVGVGWKKRRELESESKREWQKWALARRAALHFGLVARRSVDEACTRGEHSACTRARAPRVQTRATWQMRSASLTGTNETNGEHEASPSFSRFSPLSTSYNIAIGIRVIQWLDFELQASKLSHPDLRNKAMCISYMRQEDNIYNNRVYRDKCHNNIRVLIT